MSNDQDIITIDADLVHETDKAYLIDTGQVNEIWVPKSLCEYKYRSGELEIPEWLAVEKELV